MVSGPDGVIGQNVLSLVVGAFRNDQEHVLLPGTMADGVKATVLM